MTTVQPASHRTGTCHRALVALALLACSVFTLTSCSDWLDVQPTSEEREKDLFTSYKGYREALAGCYTAMADQNCYGRRLTMTDLEMLDCLWEEPSYQGTPYLIQFYNHNYTGDEARAAIKDIYAGLFNVIAQSNMIIKHLDADKTSISSEQARNIVSAEAHAIRAYCQLDVLRLFGQMPQHAERTVALPYAESVSLTQFPAYYGFDEYVKKLLADLDYAEGLLKQHDPVMKYTFGQLNGEETGVQPVDDDFLMYRQMRMNYWAVKGIKARLYLYIGDKAKAYAEAKQIIDATIDGQKVISLSGVDDIRNRYYALPSECLFALGNNKLLDYSINTIGGDASTSISPDRTVHVTPSMLDEQLYEGQNTSSNNRYLNVWERNTTDNANESYPTIKKYYYNPANVSDLNILRTKLQIMPLLRLSEIYLIAMECTPNLAEGNELYKTYMESHNVNVTTDFGSMEELQAEVVNEYRREFYGEGVMFYTDKRLGNSELFFAYGSMADDQYVLPLPATEFDPNLSTK